MMKIYNGKLNFHISGDDSRFEFKNETAKFELAANDVILLKTSNNKPMSIIGPLPENYSISSLKELLGEYYPVFVQAAFDNNPVELCRITF